MNEKNLRKRQLHERTTPDILLSGGRIIDPSRNFDGVGDLLVVNGNIKRVSSSIDAYQGCLTVDVSGYIVTPGLVDIHSHLYFTGGAENGWAGELSIDPDAFSFRSGVTTMVDTGSSGWKNFEHFRSTVIDRVHTRVFGFINIARFGMIHTEEEQDLKNFSPELCAEIAEKHQDVVVGFKTAHYEKPDWGSVDKVIEAGRIASLPVMIDFGYFQKQRPFWELVCERMRSGDIITHCYRGPVPVIDEQGQVYRYLFEARRRGIIFDLGHGGGSFLFRNVVPALEQGFPPDTISTDLHVLSMNRHLMDMPTVMSKFLALGMPVPEIINRTTAVPARVIGHTELGTLADGSEADIAIWSIEEGTFGFSDSQGGKIGGSKRFVCEAVLRAGEIVWDRNARFSRDYRELPSDCGIRRGKEVLVRPPADYGCGD